MNRDEIVSKIKNMYIMLLYAITKEDIYRVKQYLSDELVDKYDRYIKSNVDKNIVQKYGELNVSSVDIESVMDSYIVANIAVKYIDYSVDRTTKKFIDGETTRSTHYVTLRIRYQEHNKDEVYRCPSCGALLNIHLSGVCKYCNEPLDDSESVFVIESIE